MKKDNKKALYESIMTSVAKEVKNALNESEMSFPQKMARYLCRFADTSMSIKSQKRFKNILLGITKLNTNELSKFLNELKNIYNYSTLSRGEKLAKDLYLQLLAVGADIDELKIDYLNIPYYNEFQNNLKIISNFNQNELQSFINEIQYEINAHYNPQTLNGKFKIGDKVEVIKGAFKGDTGTISNIWVSYGAGDQYLNKDKMQKRLIYEVTCDNGGIIDCYSYELTKLD